MEKGILSLRGEKEEKGKKFYRITRYYGSFCRSFSLPDNVDASKINASFKNGLQERTILETEAKKPKTIEVRVK